MPSTGTLVCVTPWDTDDTTYHTFVYNSTDDRQGYGLADMPSDFGTMDTVSVIPTVIYRLSEALANDTISLDCRVVNAGQTVLLAGQTSTYDDTSWRVIANNISNTTDVTWAPGTAFAWNNSSSGKTVWDTAVLEVRMRKTKSGGWDAATLQVDYGAIVGTYTAASPVVTGTGAGSGTATLSATGLRVVLGTASASAAGSGDATGLRVVLGSGSVSATGAGDATGLRVVSGEASGSATATLDATGTVVGAGVEGTAAGSATATLTASGILVRYWTLRPNGEGTWTGIESGDWTYVDEPVSSPNDADYVINVAGTSASAFLTLTDTPGDFSSADSITLSMRAQSRGTTGDQALHFQLFQGDETTPITVEVTRTFSTDEVRTDSDVAMAWSAGAPTKAQLDGARLRVRWTV